MWLFLVCKCEVDKVEGVRCRGYMRRIERFWGKEINEFFMSVRCSVYRNWS